MSIRPLVPWSSDRRSYYFLVAPVAGVSRERRHRGADRSVNTADPRLTEWELAAATPLVTPFSSLSSICQTSPICKSFCCDVIHPQPSPKYHPGSEVACIDVKSALVNSNSPLRPSYFTIRLPDKNRLFHYVLNKLLWRSISLFNAAS